MSTFNAGDIIDKTLIAKAPVKVLSAPSYREETRTIATVRPGNSVGVVFSFVGGDQGRPLNWMFKDQGRTYYVEHRPGLFDVSSLKQQGVLTAEQKEERKREEEKTLPEKAVETFGNLGKIAIFGGLAIGALYVILTSRERKR